MNDVDQTLAEVEESVLKLLNKYKALLGRAADALDYSADRQHHIHFIAELRKAAE